MLTPPDLDWAHPPERVACDRRDVHLWRVALDAPAPRVHALAQTLDGEERERAERFQNREHRRRSIVARGALRAILARYLDCRPARVRLGRGPHGKPRVIGEDDVLRFSVSHSHELALVSVRQRRETGVDLEYVRADLATRGVAARFLSPRALARLRHLPDRQFTEEFFACWTRQEAYLKARGYGFAQGEPAELEQGAGWLVVELRPGPGYVGALAVEGESCQLQGWDWLDRPSGDHARS